MPKPSLLPILDEDLEEFCGFANRQFGSRRSDAEWVAAFSHDWCDHKPNNGFMLRAGDEIVGGIGAIYASRTIRGEREHFCNITSWCVLDEHRSHSMRLAAALLGQKGLHFTDFTATAVVARTLRFFKFEPLDSRQILIPSLPYLLSPGAGPAAIDDLRKMGDLLPPPEAEVLRDHADIAWLEHLVIDASPAPVHVVYKPVALRRFTCAVVLSVSNRETFARSYRTFARHLKDRHRIHFARMERRFLPRSPWLSFKLKRSPRRLFRSPSLGETDIDTLYSEVVSLDLPSALQ